MSELQQQTGNETWDEVVSFIDRKIEQGDIEAENTQERMGIICDVYEDVTENPEILNILKIDRIEHSVNYFGHNRTVH